MENGPGLAGQIRRSPTSWEVRLPVSMLSAFESPIFVNRKSQSPASNRLSVVVVRADLREQLQDSLLIRNTAKPERQFAGNPYRTRSAHSQNDEENRRTHAVLMAGKKPDVVRIQEH